MTLGSQIQEKLVAMEAEFDGGFLRPTDAGYDDARQVHNGLIDRRPALIARCQSTADIADAVRLGRDLGLELAVRGGGHNVAGRATVDDGLMIDLAPMKAVFVDPKRRTARAQGGVTWGEFNRSTQLYSLATTGGVVSTTGIAGLTLGGGLGWLMAEHGLALDNLLSAEVVLADGSVVQANAEENDDLFWALRGGGGNFGVVSSFEYKLHPVGPMVTGGLVANPFENGREVLRFYRDRTAALPDEMTVFAGLVHAPDGSGMKLAAILPCHTGPASVGEAAMADIKAFGSPVMDAVGPIPYNTMNTLMDDGFPKGALNYWKSSFLSELSDDAIDVIYDCFARCPTPMGAIVLEHFHGEATRIAVDATAFPHRQVGYNLLILGEWVDPSTTDACIAWVRNTYKALEPFMTSARYVNYMADDETADAVATAYGPNYTRLQKVKKAYDPDNIFHLNQNIQPKG